MCFYYDSAANGGASRHSLDQVNFNFQRPTYLRYLYTMMLLVLVWPSLRISCSGLCLRSRASSNKIRFAALQPEVLYTVWPGSLQRPSCLEYVLPKQFLVTTRYFYSGSLPASPLFLSFWAYLSSWTLYECQWSLQVVSNRVHGSHRRFGNSKQDTERCKPALLWLAPSFLTLRSFWHWQVYRQFMIQYFHLCNRSYRVIYHRRLRF